MPDGTHDSRKRDTLMRLPIGELMAWHLMVTCPGCPPARRERAVMVRDLVPRFGAHVALVSLTSKLGCREGCRRVPERIMLRSRFPAQPGPAIVEVVVKDSSVERGPMRFA